MGHPGLCTPLQRDFQRAYVWAEAKEQGWMGWKRLRTIIVALCLTATDSKLFLCFTTVSPLPSVVTVLLCGLKNSAQSFCQSKSACVYTRPHVRPTSAGGVGHVFGCRWSVVSVGGWECALKQQGSPPWPLCNSFFSQNSLAYPCDIMIVSTATNYDDINKPL